MEKQVFSDLDDLTAKLDELVTNDDWRAIVELVNFDNAILNETDGGTPPTAPTAELPTWDYCLNEYHTKRENLKDNLITDTWDSSDVLTNFFTLAMVLPTEKGREFEDMIDAGALILDELGESYESERLKRDAAEVYVLSMLGVTIS